MGASHLFKTKWTLSDELPTSEPGTTKKYKVTKVLWTHILFTWKWDLHSGATVGYFIHNPHFDVHIICVPVYFCHPVVPVNGLLRQDWMTWGWNQSLSHLVKHRNCQFRCILIQEKKIVSNLWKLVWIGISRKMGLKLWTLYNCDKYQNIENILASVKQIMIRNYKTNKSSQKRTPRPLYRVLHQLADYGWVDFVLKYPCCSVICAKIPSADRKRSTQSQPNQV